MTRNRLFESSRKPTVEQTPASVTPSSDQNHAQKPTPWWAIHRRMYDWALRLAHSNNATLSLFGISFAESSFFPTPPEVTLTPLCQSNRKRWAWFAAVTTIGSVLGAILGYVIVYEFLDIALIPSINQDKIDALANEFKERGQLYVFIAALTSIPFKRLTITAGTAKMNLGFFLMACITRLDAQSLPNCGCATSTKTYKKFFCEAVCSHKSFAEQA